MRDFPVPYGCRSCNRIRLANVAWLRQHDRSNQCNVTDVDRADACVANRREEPPLIRDHRLECEEALKKEIWPKERIAKSKLKDASFYRSMVPKETHGGIFFGAELR